MEVNVLAFGQIAEIIGQSSVRVKDVADTDALKSFIEQHHPAATAIPFVIAVNKTVIKTNTQLTQDSTVALLPPFSGG